MDLKQIYKSIWNEIINSEKITLVTHIKPDGDTIGSAIALKKLIQYNLPEKEVKISGAKYPRFLSFLPKNDVVSDDYFNESLVIVVDTSTINRIFDKRVVTKKAIKIDHHHKENDWLLEIGGDHWPATGQVIFEMAESLGLKRNKEIDEAIFVAIWTDTEGLTQRKITKETHKALDSLDINKDSIVSKMMPTKEELKIISSSRFKVYGDVSYCFAGIQVPDDIYRQYVNGVFSKTKTEVILVIVEKETKYRASLRSRGNKDVSRYAASFGGGGHFSSAGFDIEKNENIDIIANKIIKEINE